MVVEERKDCTLVYDEDKKCLIQQWSGYSGSDNFRATIQASIEFFKKHQGARALISDTRQHKVVKPEDAEWAAKHANPILVEHGMRRMAFVLPKSLVAQISVDHFSKNSTEMLELKHFDNMEDALAWVGR